MFNRCVCLFLVGVVLLIALSFDNLATPASAGKARSGAGKARATDSLQMQQTQTTTPDGTTTYRMTGQYNTGLGLVKLRTTTVKGPNFNILRPLPIPGPTQNGTSANPNSAASPSMPNSVSQEPGYDPGGDYYYSQSEMSKSDGTPIVEVTYEYEEYANRSVYYTTFGEVTQSFDFNTEEVSPITDDQAAQLDAWMASQDGHMAQDTTVAITQQGSQQASGETLLNYYLLGMLIDNDPTPGATAKGNSKGGAHSSRTASAKLAPASGAGATFALACYVPSNSLVSSPANFLVSGPSNSLVSGGSPLKSTFARVRVGCFGCCGPGCNCISDRCGIPIYGAPCAAHDDCAGRTGRWFGPCRASFARAAAYTFAAWYTCGR
jgi:hypothetical protein